jgi:CRISPR-associated protein Cmr1
VRIKAVYKINTEMFMGDKNPDVKARLRAASVKGALRFWFRALSLADYQTWEKVQETEDKVFGSINNQAAILMSLEDSSRLEKKSNCAMWSGGRGYLAYGLEKEKDNGKNENCNNKAKVLRPYIAPDQIFSLKIIQLRDDVDISNLVRAVKLLGLIGGLGSRSRRGFGSVMLQSLLIDGKEEWHPAKTTDELQEQILHVVPIRLPVDLPEYTAFSHFSRVVIVKESHEGIGDKFQKYRKDHFKKDGLIAKTVYHDGKVTEHPERVAFGLPHNYFFGNDKKLEIKSKMCERRASPLFVHIHEINKEQVCVLSLLPARFLPKGDKIQYKNQGIEVECRDELQLYKTIKGFLDLFKDKTEVLPCKS